MPPISYARHQFPPEVIQHAVWLYLRFTLSYRPDCSTGTKQLLSHESRVPAARKIATENNDIDSEPETALTKGGELLLRHEGRALQVALLAETPVNSSHSTQRSKN